MLKISSEVASGNVILRPAPFISISHTPLRNNAGTMGCNYSITLNGTIIVPPAISVGKKLSYILNEQNYIRRLFSKDGTKCTLFGLDGDTEKVSLIFYPNVISINFQEGIYVDTCNYTIDLEAPFLFNKDNNILPEGLNGSFNLKKYNIDRDKYSNNSTPSGLDDFILEWGGVIEDFTDSWSIDVDDAYSNTTETYDPNKFNPIYDSGSTSDIFCPKVYRLTRNISATGRTFYAPSGTGVIRYEGYDQAFGFIKKTLLGNSNKYPKTSGYQKYALYPGFIANTGSIIDDSSNIFSSGLLNIPHFYQGFNHLRSINFDKSAGSCGVIESWILASGDTAIENYNITIDSSRENPRKNVKINGSIKGLSPAAASGYNYPDYLLPPYSGALNKYFKITNNGRFGINSILYKRLKNIVSGINLNAQPLSISLATNELAGEINYSLEFDNRPLNYFKGVAFESITINDTYPGDIYAVIPVIGRSTGPILQAIYARTSYNRDVSIELVLDHTDISYGASGTLTPQQNRTKLLMNKPIINYNAIYPIRKQVKDLLIELCPSGEPDVTTYFLKPPTENWLPLEGRYSINLSWEYEKSL